MGPAARATRRREAPRLSAPAFRGQGKRNRIERSGSFSDVGGKRPLPRHRRPVRRRTAPARSQCRETMSGKLRFQTRHALPFGLQSGHASDPARHRGRVPRAGSSGPPGSTCRGEVLGVGGAAGVADQRLAHDRERTFSSRHWRFSPHGVSATPLVQAATGQEHWSRVSGGGSAYASSATSHTPGRSLAAWTNAFRPVAEERGEQLGPSCMPASSITARVARG